MVDRALRKGARLLIVATHPVQYQVPWYVALSANSGVNTHVLYLRRPTAQQQGSGFGVAFKWDLPMFEGYECTELASGRSEQPPRWLELWSALRAAKPNLVILTGWQKSALIKLALLARFTGIPVLVRGDSNDLRLRSWPIRCMHWLLFRLYDGFLVVGRANRRLYQAHGIQDARLSSCPHFVDNRRFQAFSDQARREAVALRQRWSIPSEAVCLLYAGKLEPKKRILDLLAALRLALPLASHRLHLLVVGSGVLQGQAQAYAQEHSLPVTFAGFLNQSEIPKSYAVADLLVLPSDYGETWGLVVNEAMACGVPALVSDRVGCAEDLIRDGDAGGVFPFGNVEALADHIVSLTRDREALRHKGQVGQQRVVKHYSVEAAVEGTLAAVRQVMSGRTRSA
jgi:glycosyltransferase involved in cell wall biosynthesis